MITTQQTGLEITERGIDPLEFNVKQLGFQATKSIADENVAMPKKELAARRSN